MLSIAIYSSRCDFSFLHLLKGVLYVQYNVCTYVCVYAADWSELCETHITGPGGILTGYALLIYLLITSATRCFPVM